jgi:DNA-binding transcriptional regulator YdaS (Cro superfamily)
MTITVDGELCVGSMEAAQRLGLHPSRLTQWIGRLRARRFHGLLIPERELDALVQERKAKKTNA